MSMTEVSKESTMIHPGYTPSRSSFPATPDDGMRDKLATIRCKALEFGTAIGMNVASLKGAAIPGFNLPWWVKLVPSPLRVNFRRYREIKVRNEDFLCWLEQSGILPSRHLVSSDIWGEIASANFFRVYELRGWGAVFHVYSIFVTPMATEEREGKMHLDAKAADVWAYDAIAKFVKWWKGHLEKPNCTCLTIGSFGGWTDDIKVVELPDSIQVLSSPKTDETWTVRHNSLEHMRPVFRKLVYRLYPESWATWHGRICQILHDEFQNNPYAVTMTPSRMAEKARIPQDCIEEIFEDLRRTDSGWRSARDTATGDLGLLPANGKPDGGAFVRQNERMQWVAEGIAVTAYCVLSWIFAHVKSDVRHKRYLLAAIGLSAFYLVNVLANNLKRKIQK